MTNTEKLLLGIDQKLQLNNKILNEILENMKMLQKDIGSCTKSITASNAQTIKESKAKTYQMMKMLVESRIKTSK